MEPGYINSNVPGFTLNMSHYVKQVKEIKDGFIINGNSWLRIKVDSTYSLGYFFGAYVSRGLSNLSRYRGQVVFRFYDDEEITKLYESIEDSFNLAPRFRTLGVGRNEMVVYCKPLAKLVSEFGKGAVREIPRKYMVGNVPYLSGICDGIEDMSGHIPDSREIIKRREYSPFISKIHSEVCKFIQ